MYKQGVVIITLAAAVPIWLLRDGEGKKPEEASGVDVGGKVFGESRLAFVDREGTVHGAGLGFIGK